MVATENALKNEILLNPRFTSQETASLIEVAQKVSSEMKLQGHIWLSTSGSTSEAAIGNKLVALSKAAFLASAQSVNEHLQVSSSDTWLQVLPRFHVGGLGIEYRARLSGSRVVSDFEKWNAERAHQLILAEKVTIASMVPTQIFDLIQAKLKSPKYLRAVIVGGGALTEALYLEARRWGWPLLPSYGMTETCSQIATATLESLQTSERLPQSKKLNHVEWRVTGDKILEVTGTSLMTCYGQRQTDGSIRGWDPKVGGWFTSEDHVELKGSFVRVTGRKNDFVKIGGEGSSMSRLREIWDRILERERCGTRQQYVLIDAKSERLGSEIHLVSELPSKDKSVELLKDIFNGEVLPFERIREVKYIDQIPRSDLGKVLWAKLKRDLYGS